jgi:SulP family sulfate permease
MKNIFGNLRHDLFASIVVFFVALPLCLGIALASGAPLFSGIIAGITGGIVVGLISGSALGVSGPAAGLAVLVLGYVKALGDSWEAFLLAVVISGVIQLIAGFLKLGNIAYYFPSSVIKGMLTGIGLIIILKQIPHAVGYDNEFKDDFDFDQLDPGNTYLRLAHMLRYLAPNPIIITTVSMLILIVWEIALSAKGQFAQIKIFKIIPGPLMAVVIGIVLSNFLHLKESQIVQIPVANNLGRFFAQFTLPDFTQLKNPDIYFIAIIIAVVASLETLLCLEATDRMDVQKRVTPTNLELKAQGIGNIVSGLLGGLPLTQVVVRSSANINFGAKSKLSTILHGFLLLISVITISNLLNMIPLATLACILLVIGYKLAKPSAFKEMYKLGLEQFLPFITTIIGILVFDLLKGVAIGMIMAIYFILRNNFRNCCKYVEKKEDKQNQQHIIALCEEVSFLNKSRILQMLNKIPANSSVVIDGSKSSYIDYDVIEIIRDFQANAKTKNIFLEIKNISKCS